eukprot:g2751.t1
MKPPAKPKVGSFQAMGLSQDLFRGIMAMGYKVPTPVQRKSLPVTLAGADVVVMARTGSGKTAAFLIPVLEKLGSHSHKMGARSIILSPTRELAVQTLTFARKMSKLKDLRMALLVGGDSMDKQFAALADNPDIIIATPGRLMHHLQEVPEFTLRSVEVIVFDEADRLFEMGFAEQLREIMRGVPEERQSLLFSATMPKQLVQFARAGLKDPVLIRLDTESKISTELSLAFFTCRTMDKPAALLFLLREVIPEDDMTIVFVATRHHAEFLHELLREAGTMSSVVYGAMDQEARSIHLDKFRKGKTKLLVVTDVAARGIDVPLLNNVINYAFPPAPKLFVHRVGRAARQGRTGTAYSIVDPEEIPHMLDLHLFLGRKPSNVHAPPGGAPGPDGTTVDDAEVGGTEQDDGAGAGGRGAIVGYDVPELNPDLVHYGNFPQQVMDDENESLKEIIGNSGSALAGLQRVCQNAMKQYRRTRPDPSGRAIVRAKLLDRGETHPLLVKFEARGMHSAAAHAGRNEFMRAMSSFRPKETIFELLGGGGTEAKAKGDMDQVMGAVRKRARVHRLLTRNEATAADTETAAADATATAVAAAAGAAGTSLSGDDGDGGDAVEPMDVESGGGDRVEAAAAAAGTSATTPAVAAGRTSATAASAASGGGGTGGGSDERNGGGGSSTVAVTGVKRKLSRFERKQLKKNRDAGADAGGARGRGGDALAGLEDEVEKEDAAAGGVGDGGVMGNGGPGKFADKSSYIGYGTTEASSFVEAALQPRSVEKSADGFAAGRLEEAILDVNPDEAVDMAKKQRLLHWDSRKKKFVKTTLAELSERKSGGSRKIRTESGVVVKAKNAPQGEIYAKWKRNSNRKVGRDGDEEEARGGAGASTSGGGGWGSGGGRGRRGGWGDTFRGGGEEEAGAAAGKGAREQGGRVVRDELKTKGQIRKNKQKDENKKLKNMPKAKRRALLKKKEAKVDHRKQAAKSQVQMKGRTRSRMRVRV